MYKLIIITALLGACGKFSPSSSSTSSPDSLPSTPETSQGQADEPVIREEEESLESYLERRDASYAERRSREYLEWEFTTAPEDHIAYILLAPPVKYTIVNRHPNTTSWTSYIADLSLLGPHTLTVQLDRLPDTQSGGQLDILVIRCPDCLAVLMPTTYSLDVLTKQVTIKLWAESGLLIIREYKNDRRI